MPIRTYLSIILLVTSAIPSFAQVGTRERATQAAKNETEPEYIKTLMERLSVKIDRYAATKNLEDPVEKLILLSTMQGIIDLAQACAYGAAIDGAALAHAPINAYYAAEAAAFNQAKVQTENTFKSIKLAAHAKSYKSTRLDQAIDSAKLASMHAALIGDSPNEKGRIAYRVAEWETLNWILRYFETEIGKIDPAAQRIARRYQWNSPFKSDESSSLFYYAKFEGLSDSVMQFLAPWLIHLVPAGSAGRHQDLFNHLQTVNANARVI